MTEELEKYMWQNEVEKQLERAERYLVRDLKEKNKLLQAKVFQYRHILDTRINQNNRDNLAYIIERYTEDDEQRVNNILNAISNNPILKEYDTHFSIEIHTQGKIEENGK